MSINFQLFPFDFCWGLQSNFKLAKIMLDWQLGGSMKDRLEKMITYLKKMAG